MRPVIQLSRLHCRVAKSAKARNQLAKLLPETSLLCFRLNLEWQASRGGPKHEVKRAATDSLALQYLQKMWEGQECRALIGKAGVEGMRVQVRVGASLGKPLRVVAAANLTADQAKLPRADSLVLDLLSCTYAHP